MSTEPATPANEDNVAYSPRVAGGPMGVEPAAPDDDDSLAMTPSLPRVRVIRSPKRHKTVSARLNGGVLQVRIPAWLPREEADSLVHSVVARFSEKWRCSHVPLTARARELARRFDLPEPASISWSYRQRFRWGSCSPHSSDIRISSRLAQAPPWVLDHVIVHELAHLVVADHSREFENLVKRNPDAEKAEGYLLAMNDMAPALESPEALAG